MSYKIKNSKIEGKGAFANKAYKKGDQISDESDYANEANQSLLSFFHNHDEKNANMNYVIGDGVVNMIASKDIKVGDELVSNYYDMQYPGSPYEDPSEFEKKKKTLGKRKRKLKEGGPHDPPEKSKSLDEVTVTGSRKDPPNKYYDKNGNLIKDIPSYGTIYTSDPNDPKIQEFKDRLDLYNLSKKNYLDTRKDEVDSHIKGMRDTIDYWYSINEPQEAKEPEEILEKLIQDRKNISSKDYLSHYRNQKGGYDVSETDLFDDILSGNFDEYKDYGKMLPDDMGNYTQKELDKIAGLYYSVGLDQKQADILKQGLKLGYKPYVDHIYDGGVTIDYPYPSLTVRYANPEKYDWAKPVEEKPEIQIDRLPIIEPSFISNPVTGEIITPEEDFNNDYKAKRVVDKETHYKVNKKGKFRRGPFGKKTTRSVRYEMPEEEQIYPEGFVARFKHGGPTEDELSYFVDDAGKPFKYKGKTWSDIAKLSDEEQGDYVQAFSNYEKLKGKRDYESNRKSKLDPFYKLDPYGYGKTTYGTKDDWEAKYDFNKMSNNIKTLYKEQFPDEKLPKVETLSDFNKASKKLGMNVYFVDEGDGAFSITESQDIADRIYNNGLTATQLSKMGLGSKQEIQDYFAPTFTKAQYVYDKRNLESIEKDILAGVSVKDAIQKIADKNQGTVEGLTKLYETSSVDAQNKLIKRLEKYYSGSNKEGFFGSDYDEKSKNFKDENLGKMEGIFEEMRTGKFNPNATMEDAMNYYSASTALDEAKDPLKKFTEEVKNKDLSNEEKIKLYNNLFKEFDKDQQKKAQEAFFMKQRGSFKSDEEMTQHLEAQDDITNPYRKASTFTKLLHPIDALGHLSKYGNTDRMMETNPSAGIWKDNLVMQALDGASYLAPGLGQVRAAQLLGDAGKGFFDYGSQWVKDGEAPDMSYLAAPVLQGTFGALGARTGLNSLKPYKNIFKPNSQTFLARPSMTGTKAINLPGNRQISYGNPFKIEGNTLTKLNNEQLLKGQQFIDDAFAAEKNAFNIMDFNKKRNVIGSLATSPLSFTGTWDAMLGTGSQPKYRAAATSFEKTGGVIKLPKNKKLPKHNMRGIVKNLAKYYPDMEVAGSSLLTPDYVKRIQDIAKLKSFLTYASNIDKSLGKNREILNYNIGKQIVDGNINLEDVADSSSSLFDYDIDPRHKARDVINQEGVESLLQKILRSTEQKDFSQSKPFGDIERSAYSRQLSNQRYDHEKTMLDLYRDPNYNPAALPMESLGNGYDFTPDRDFNQQYFDLINFDYDIANPFGDNSKGLGTIRDALPVFYAKNFENARQTATYGMESINKALHSARPRTFLTDAGSKTPDSYLMGANQLIKSMNTYPEILGNTQFIGYSSLNKEAFSDAFFKGKEKAINRGELRGPYTGAPRAVADSNLEFFNRLRGDYTSNALDKIYAKYNFEGLPAIRLPLSTKMTSDIAGRNRGLGTDYSYKPGTTYFPSYAVQKLRPMSLEEALKIKFEDGGYSLGDEVDEATMKELKKLGYTLEEA